QPGLGLDLVVDEQGPGPRPGTGPTGGLDDDGVESGRARALVLHHAADHAVQVAAQRSAYDAAVHLEDTRLGADDEVVDDADLAELIDDDGVALAVVFGEDAV